MQWILNRITALCGAADVTDEQLEDEDFWFGEGGELAGSGNHPRYGSWPQPRTHPMILLLSLAISLARLDFTAE
jgi:hypothetical protein